MQRLSVPCVEYSALEGHHYHLFQLVSFNSEYVCEYCFVSVASVSAGLRF
jgi:hypothetical protein